MTQGDCSIKYASKFVVPWGRELGFHIHTPVFALVKGPFSCFQRRQWHPTPVLLPGKSHGQRSLVGCSPWWGEKSDTTEWLHLHFSLWCTGEGNGNPLQCSCLENPRDWGAWWAAVYGVAQSWKRLKWLSSSSSSRESFISYECINFITKGVTEIFICYSIF